MKQLYTFGYLSSNAERVLKELIALRTPLVDVRYSPNSKRYEWSKQALERKTGLIYYWVQSLGNENYKQALTGQYTEPRIKLHDEINGLKELGVILAEYGRVAIMCACTSKTTCHRILVARLACEQLGVKIHHL